MATDQTPTNKPMIKFSEVNKWYGTHHVLQNISLEVAKGEVVVVCGPSGSGNCGNCEWSWDLFFSNSISIPT